MSAKGSADEYTRWLTLIPDEERDRVAELILSHSMTDFESVGKLCKVLLAETVRGTISPTVGHAAIEFTQMMFTCVGAGMASQGMGNEIRSGAFAELENLATQTKRIQDTAIEFATVDVAPATILDAEFKHHG